MESLIEEHSIVPRSCWTCRRKKVKCDRKDPCETCVRLGVKCTYPEVERRKHARPALVKALLGRLSELEGKSQPSEGHRRSELGTNSQANVADKLQVPLHQVQSWKAHHESDFHLAQEGLGDSRFFNDGFTSDLIKESGDIGLDMGLPTTKRVGPSALLQPPCWPSNLPDLNTLSSDCRDAVNLWQIFVSNFHPITQVIHLPSAQTRFLQAVLGEYAEESQKFLVVAICFAAVVTIDDDQTIEKFVNNRSTLLQLYRDQAEKYVSNYSLLTRPNLEYIQALLIFIIALRSLDSTRAVWVLTGIALRTAQSIGLHVDGKTMGLQPFECEIRRKVWWQLFMLEVRTAEDHGLLVGDIASTTSPPQYPSNLNDVDIWPNMSELPHSSLATTSSTLVIIWIRLFQEILHPALAPMQTDGTTLLNVVEQRRQKAREAYIRIGDQYFSTEQHRNQPYYPPGFALWRFSIAKADFLILFQAYQCPSLDNKEIIRQETVISALNVVEGVVRARSNQGVTQFRWMARSNRQWFAIGFLLQQLSKGLITEDDLQQRAHTALDILFTAEDDDDQSLFVQRRGAVWIAMKLLRTKALYSNRNSPAEAFANNISDFTSTPDYIDDDLFDQIFNIDQSIASDYDYMNMTSFVQ